MEVKNEEETTLNRANGNLTIRHAPAFLISAMPSTSLVRRD